MTAAPKNPDKKVTTSKGGGKGLSANEKTPAKSVVKKGQGDRGDAVQVKGKRDYRNAASGQFVNNTKPPPPGKGRKK